MRFAEPSLVNATLIWAEVLFNQGHEEVLSLLRKSREFVTKYAPNVSGKAQLFIEKAKLA